MKTTKEIADDCGLGEHEARLLEEIMCDHKNGITEEIVGALYRRIETLEGGMVIYLAEKDREIAELCDAVNEKKRRIEKLEEQLPESIGDDGSIAIQHPPSPADAPCLTIRQFFSAARAVKEYEEKKGVWTGGAVIVRLEKDEGLYQAIPRAYLTDAAYLGSRDVVDIDEVRSLI